VNESLLFKMVHEDKMPPNKKDRLSEAEIRAVRQWIETEGQPVAAKNERRQAVTSVTQHEITHMMLMHCTACHGGRKKEGGLDLRTRAAMLKGGKSGPAFVPGHPEKSLMLKKVQAGDMPPFLKIRMASVLPLTADETERLSQWIALGAP